MEGERLFFWFIFFIFEAGGGVIFILRGQSEDCHRGATKVYN
jgi:hypothetical protein